MPTAVLATIARVRKAFGALETMVPGSVGQGLVMLDLAGPPAGTPVYQTIHSLARHRDRYFFEPPA